MNRRVANTIARKLSKVKSWIESRRVLIGCVHKISMSIAQSSGTYKVNWQHCAYWRADKPQIGRKESNLTATLFVFWQSIGRLKIHEWAHKAISELRRSKVHTNSIRYYQTMKWSSRIWNTITATTHVFFKECTACLSMHIRLLHIMLLRIQHFLRRVSCKVQSAHESDPKQKRKLTSKNQEKKGQHQKHPTVKEQPQHSN